MKRMEPDTLPAAHAPRRLALPALTATEAQARSVLAQRGRDLAVRCGGVDWRLSIVPALPGERPAGGPGTWRVRVSWAGTGFEILLPAAAPSAWIEARHPGLPVPGLADEFAAAALEDACADLLASLQALGFGEARIDGVSREEAPQLDWPHVLALEAVAPMPVRAWLGTDSLGLMQLAGLAARQPVAANALPPDALPLCLRAEIGFTWLAAAELRGLAVGDAVLLEHSFTTPDGEIWMGAEGWGFRAYWGDNNLTVTAPLSEGGWMMERETTGRAAAEAAGIDGLPLRLAFDLGERSITLGELRHLQVGQALDLGRPLSHTVSLRVNGALVGSGELVEIDGRLGVVITAIAGAAPEASAPLPQQQDLAEDDAPAEAEEAWEQE